MPKQRRLTPDERRATLAAFLPPGLDELPTGAEIMLPLGMKRLPIAARLRSVMGATQADVDRIAEADRAKRNEQPAASPEWIQQPKEENAR